jgi:hypothetical protein
VHCAAGKSPPLIAFWKKIRSCEGGRTLSTPKSLERQDRAQLTLLGSQTTAALGPCFAPRQSANTRSMPSSRRVHISRSAAGKGLVQTMTASGSRFVSASQIKWPRGHNPGQTRGLRSRFRYQCSIRSCHAFISYTESRMYRSAWGQLNSSLPAIRHCFSFPRPSLNPPPCLATPGSVFGRQSARWLGRLWIPPFGTQPAALSFSPPGMNALVSPSSLAPARMSGNGGFHLLLVVKALVVVLQNGGALLLARVVGGVGVDDVAREDFLPEGKASARACQCQLGQRWKPLGGESRLTSGQTVSRRHFERSRACRVGDVVHSSIEGRIGCCSVGSLTSKHRGAGPRSIEIVAGGGARSPARFRPHPPAVAHGASYARRTSTWM